MKFSDEQITRMRDAQDRGISIKRIAADEGLDYQLVWRFLTGRTYQENSETHYAILKRIENRLIEMETKLADLSRENTERTNSLIEKFAVSRDGEAL